MRTLNRKLLRDLRRLWAQSLAIALVVASGVTTHVVSHSAMRTLTATQDAFYREGQFADVFVSLRRAPRSLEPLLAELPGVQLVETRIASAALVDLPDFADPVSAQVLSLPDARSGLNRLYLRAGRLPETDDDVAVNAAFAQANALHVGGELRVNLRGRVRTLRITGIVLSPEFVYLIRPGDLFPDFRRYGVLWMTREPLAAAQGLDGAFNSVSLTLQAGAEPRALIAALDRLLAPYGSSGAITRADQISHRTLSEEMKQLRTQARVVPAIFLGVAAFLLYIVMLRLLQQERTQIAVLKAFGYREREIATHYLQFAGLIALAGALIGLIAGSWLGAGMAQLYAEFFFYPSLRYRLDADIVGWAVLISVGAALAGAALAVRRVGQLPPAQGMRPEAPPRFHDGMFERSRLRRRLAPATRMVVRNLLRQPVKSALTVTGIAAAVAIVVVGGYSSDAIDFLIDTQFRRSWRADLSVAFDEIRPPAAVHALQAIPGVRVVEPFRIVSARLVHGQRSHRVGIQGVEAQAQLNRVLDKQFQPIDVPPQGLLMTDHLAHHLGLVPGDSVTVEVLDGARPTLQLPIAGLTHELAGYGVYMDRSALNALLRNGNVVSGAHLGVDPGMLEALYAQLKQTPRVMAVSNRRVALRNFEDTMARNMLVFALVNLILASTIAVGVVYNSMRIALSERTRELASLRVLGYTRAEAAAVLLGESYALTVIAIPIGCVIGWALCAALAQALSSELFRMPVVLTPPTYAFAAVVVTATTVASSLLMTRHIRRLDLVSALKVPQ